MSYAKLILFAASLAVLAGCGSSSSSGGGPGGQVAETAYDGDAGKFASLYTGTCTVQAGNRTYTSCNAQVRIKQTASSIFVRTQFFVNQSNSRSEKITGTSQDQITVAGKQLLQDQTQVGVIGSDGFYYTTRGNQPFHFVRLYPNNYEFQGTFADSTGRQVQVTGRVQRGAKVQGSAHRTADVRR